MTRNRFFLTVQRRWAYVVFRAMKATVTFIVLASALSVTAIPGYAQEDAFEHRNRAMEARALRDSLAANQNLHLVVEASYETYAEFLEGRDEDPQVRSWFFVREIEKFASQIEELYYASISEDRSQDEVADGSRDLSGTIDQLRDFVNFGSDPPQTIVAELPKESLAQRIQSVLNLSARLIPNVIELAVGDSIDLDLLNQVRDDLAITETLILALPQSEF